MESTPSTKQVSEQCEEESGPGAEACVDGVVYGVPRAGAGGAAEAGVAAVQAGGASRAPAARGAGGVHAGPHLDSVTYHPITMSKLKASSREEWEGSSHISYNPVDHFLIFSHFFGFG